MAQVEQEIERLRRKRKAMLIGGDWTDMMDPSDSFLQAGLDHLTNRAERLFRSMDPSNPDRLWPELEWREDASDIRSNYVRLKEMAVAYATPGSYLYRSASLCRAIVDGLEWVYRNRYNERVVFYGNWWQWEIGAPLALLDTLLLMDDEVDPDALAAYLRTVARCTPSPEPYFHTRRSEPKVSTGANRVWKCQVHLLASLLRGDAQSVREARDALSPVFAYVQAGDGFYEDGSFIQHTRHPYTGGYGKSLLRELADLLYLFDGSLWEVSRKYVRTVFRWVEDSFRPLMYNGMMADMSSGREISRSSHQNHEIGHVIIDALLRLTGLESAEGTDRLQRLAKLWMTRDMYRSYLKHAPLPLLTAAAGLLSDASVQLEEGSPECRIFAGMDQAVHRRGHFVFGVSMHSTRISTYESINGENLRGWYTSHGMTYVYNSDQGQYCDGFWPTVDPYRLPGTTVSDMPRSDGEDYAGPGLSSFAGGVLFGGQHGAAAMELYEPEPLVCRARKSWFMLGDVIVALGSGIHASGPRRLETIIDNRMLNRSGGNPVTVKADGTRRTLTSLGETTVLEPDWIHLEGNVPGADIGYYFPRKMQVSMLREARSGSWSDINADGPKDVIERNYLTLWTDHGTQPEGADYAYILVPGRSAEQLAAFAAGPKSAVVELSGAVHAVRDDTLGLTCVHFWEDVPRKVGLIACNTRASVMLQDDGETLELVAADPTQENEGLITIELDAAASAVTESHERITVHSLQPVIRLSLRAAGAKGQSCSIRFVKLAEQ